jgi:F-type H+-transporting ATPase subunit gamma
MAKARRILKRASAVKKIRALTRTMEMISTSRFRSSHLLSGASRPYTDRLTALVADVLARVDTRKFRHPLLESRTDVKRDVLLVITSNRGLCGSHNQQVLRLALERLDQTLAAGYEIRLHVAGKKGLAFFGYRKMQVERSFIEFDNLPEYQRIGRLAQEYMDLYARGEIGGLEVAYTRMPTGGAPRPAIAQVLPLSELSAPPKHVPTAGEEPKLDIYPSAEELLRHLLPATVRLRLYQCFLDASVAEQMARMTAMRSATENADEMVQDLTRKYNRTRQAQITTELSEIIGGRGALE